VPDILVNNAGIFPRCDFLAMEEAEWDAVLGINLKAAAFMTQAFARALSGRAGAVVNLSSSAVRGDPRGSVPRSVRSLSRNPRLSPSSLTLRLRL
jgi:NAD(P)-dependent dehydrogenase (short-subunit alcohol dehydrogenase family)